VPVLGFNSGWYDLNLIREYFAERLSDTTGKVRVAKKGNKIMFLLTQGFCFQDIINYLGLGTSYEKWTKAYESTAKKTWFPYQWFDIPEKLDHPGLLDYPVWYSCLVGDRVGDTEDQLGELCLEQAHQISVLEMYRSAGKYLLHQPVLSNIFRDFRSFC